MSLKVVTRRRLAELNHNVVAADGQWIECSCGWRYELGVNDSSVVAMLGHLYAVTNDTNEPYVT